MKNILISILFLGTMHATFSMEKVEVKAAENTTNNLKKLAQDTAKEIINPIKTNFKNLNTKNLKKIARKIRPYISRENLLALVFKMTNKRDITEQDIFICFNPKLFQKAELLKAFMIAGEEDIRSLSIILRKIYYNYIATEKESTISKYADTAKWISTNIAAGTCLYTILNYFIPESIIAAGITGGATAGIAYLLSKLETRSFEKNIIVDFAIPIANYIIEEADEPLTKEQLWKAFKQTLIEQYEDINKINGTVKKDFIANLETLKDKPKALKKAIEDSKIEDEALDAFNEYFEVLKIYKAQERQKIQLWQTFKDEINKQYKNKIQEIAKTDFLNNLEKIIENTEDLKRRIKARKINGKALEAFNAYIAFVEPEAEKK